MSLGDACKAQCAFFDDLANRIPPKFYFEQEEVINLHGMKKKEKDKLQKQFKKIKIRNKKNKQDPDFAKTTLELQKEQLNQNQKLKEKGIVDENDEGGIIEGAKINVEQNVDRELLQQRLNEKLEGFKSARKAIDEKKQQNAKSAKDFKNKQREKSAEKLKRKRKQEQNKKQKELQLLQQQQQQQSEEAGREGEGEGQGFEFTRVGLGQQDLENNHPRKKGKVQEKQEILKKLEKKQTHMKELHNTAEEQEILRKEGWEASIRRAQGEKVYDDPKLLKRSLKAIKKRKEKSAQAWNQRIKAQKQQMDDRQARRTDNINKKIQAKKQKRVQKREKRLLGAGFEGRREDLIRGLPEQ
eukprot:TRINITY_DN1084_c1_g1_i1.p2 TRINITY_DN1084_c1_g1~~TRINITY_DN1084_c1_g1_i1.p2  ORF type:complete len:362 (-),score=92.57 TRINITY_DN1084_c1_g1_i1:221-1285(-)